MYLLKCVYYLISILNCRPTNPHNPTPRPPSPKKELLPFYRWTWHQQFNACFTQWFHLDSINKPRHDKTHKMSVCPAKTQISLGIRPVWSESLLCAQWVAKDPRFLHADSEDSDQTGRMPRLIWVFAGHTLILLVLSCHGSNTRRYSDNHHEENFSTSVSGTFSSKRMNMFKIEPRHEKTCLRGLRPDKTQTGLLSYKR